MFNLLFLLSFLYTVNSRPADTSLLQTRASQHLSTSSKILTHLILSNITIKENKETILQLGAKRRIFCLQLDLFLVREATLETLCLHSYILIIISYV